jgi:hypothetical protein
MNTPLLFRILAETHQADRLSQAVWDIAIRQARASGLLATLHYSLLGAGMLERLPDRVRIQLAAAARVADHHREVMQWEVEDIYRVLNAAGIPVIVLKGAAYAMAGLEAASGRMFGDVDILVPHGAISEVEKELGHAGWIQDSRNAYDDRYYRKWMHEIPARRHIQRGTVLDVHHNILPLTARNKPKVSALWHAAVPLPGFTDLYTLAPTDMLLHSASHLFLNGEFERGLRDLNDFRRLARQFSGTPGFWSELQARAQMQDLAKPLAYAVRYANRLLAAGFPEACTAVLSKPAMPALDRLFTQGLLPRHSSVHNAWTPVALFALYVRGHYLRMPLHLLLPHLIYKGTLAKFDQQALQDENDQQLDRFRAFLGK